MSAVSIIAPWRVMVVATARWTPDQAAILSDPGLLQGRAAILSDPELSSRGEDDKEELRWMRGRAKWTI